MSGADFVIQVIHCMKMSKSVVLPRTIVANMKQGMYCFHHFEHVYRCMTRTHATYKDGKILAQFQLFMSGPKAVIQSFCSRCQSDMALSPFSATMWIASCQRAKLADNSSPSDVKLDAITLVNAWHILCHCQSSRKRGCLNFAILQVTHVSHLLKMSFTSV